MRVNTVQSVFSCEANVAGRGLPDGALGEFPECRNAGPPSMMNL